MAANLGAGIYPRGCGGRGSHHHASRGGGSTRGYENGGWFHGGPGAVNGGHGGGWGDNPNWPQRAGPAMPGWMGAAEAWGHPRGGNNYNWASNGAAGGNYSGNGGQNGGRGGGRNNKNYSSQR